MPFLNGLRPCTEFADSESPQARVAKALSLDVRRSMPRMQHLLREAGIIPPLMNILDGFANEMEFTQASGADASADTSAEPSAGVDQSDEVPVLICKVAHKILRHFVHNNLRNAMYLVKHGHVTTMVSRLGKELDAEQCMMELLGNSKQMLTDFVHDNCSETDDILEKLIDCVLMNQTGPVALQFLSFLCVFRQTAIPAHQEAICTMICDVKQLPQVFFATSANTEIGGQRHPFDTGLLATARHELLAGARDDTLPAFAVPRQFKGRDSMFANGTSVPLIGWDGSHNRQWPDLNNSDDLRCPGLGPVSAVHDSRGVSITLRDFSKLVSAGASPKWRYLGLLFESQMELYARLCYGRSYCAMNMLEHQFSYELVLACIRDVALLPGLRASFVKLMMHLHVDRHPLHVLHMPSLLHVYDAIPDGDADIHPASTEDPHHLFLLKISILDEITRMILVHGEGSNAPSFSELPKRPLAKAPSFKVTSQSVPRPRRASLDGTAGSSPSHMKRGSSTLNLLPGRAQPGSSRGGMLARALSSVRTELDRHSFKSQPTTTLTLELLKITCFLVKAGVFSSLPELTALSEFSAWLFSGPLSANPTGRMSASPPGRGEPFADRDSQISIISQCKETLCALLLGVADQWLDYDLRVLLAKLRRAVESRRLSNGTAPGKPDMAARSPFGSPFRQLSGAVSPGRRLSAFRNRVHADSDLGASVAEPKPTEGTPASGTSGASTKSSLAAVYNRDSAVSFVDFAPEDHECMSIIETGLASSRCEKRRCARLRDFVYGRTCVSLAASIRLLGAACLGRSARMRCSGSSSSFSKSASSLSASSRCSRTTSTGPRG